MLSAPTSAAVAGIQALFVAASLLLFGYLLAGALLGPRGDRVLRAGLALPALCGYVLFLSLIHIATGGGVWSQPWAVRITTGIAVVIALLVARRRGAVEAEGAASLSVLLAAGFVVWGIPVFLELPLFETTPLENGGDAKLHLGWTMQLLDGETTPSSPLTGEIPNYYPWFFHSLLAFVSNLTPGGRALHGLGPLQLVQVGGGVLTFFALGREVTRRLLGGWAAAVLGALSGGVGWLIARGPELETDREEPMSYLGDLALVRSYNPSFHNLAPALPRDLTYVLLPAFVLLLLLGLRKERPAPLAGAGTIAGIIGLTGAEAFFLCGLVVLGLPVAAPPGRRARSFAWVALPMAAVWGLWVVPLALSYADLGGFENTTTVGPVDVPPAGILGAWGLLTVCAVAGLPRLWRRRTRPARPLLLSTLVGATALVAFAAVTGNDGALGVLGRPHRYWPLLYVALVPVGAIGTVTIAQRFVASSRARLGIGAALLALAVPSPILGSLALSAVWDDPPPVVSDAVQGDEDALLRTLDRDPGGEMCVVAVPEDLVHSLFWFSGFRSVHYRWAPERTENYARVRWADIDERIPWDEERVHDSELLIEGDPDDPAWVDVADKYGVDKVVTIEAAVIERTDCGS